MIKNWHSVTVPLSLLQKRAIKFEPALSVEKTSAIDRLGAGLIEKGFVQGNNHLMIVKIEALLKLFKTVNILCQLV